MTHAAAVHHTTVPCGALHPAFFARDWEKVTCLSCLHLRAIPAADHRIVGPLGAPLRLSPDPKAPAVLTLPAWTHIAMTATGVEVFDSGRDYCGESRWLRFPALYLHLNGLLWRGARNG